MGYSHYWYRPPVISDAIFQNIKRDFERLILPLADIGVPLAGPSGNDEPEITDDCIAFNGVAACGHPRNEEVVIPDPADDARGIGPSSTAVVGDWYGWGVVIKHRCCNGDCAYESFTFPRIADGNIQADDDYPETDGLVGDYTKTGFRPYDIAVTAALLIAKRHLKTQMVVHSNGSDAQWADAKEICQRHLGYGAWFGIVEDPHMEVVPGRDNTQEEREVRIQLLIELDVNSLK